MESETSINSNNLLINPNNNKKEENQISYNSGNKKSFTGYKKNNQKHYLRSQYSYYNKDGKYLK